MAIVSILVTSGEHFIEIDAVIIIIKEIVAVVWRAGGNTTTELLYSLIVLCIKGI